MNERNWIYITIDILLQNTQTKIQGSGVCVVCNKNELSNELVRLYLKRSESLDILTLERCREMKFLIDR